MRYLVFIRHSQTQPDQAIPSREWVLTEEGRRRCKPLAVQLARYNLDRIVTSTEPKAIETGKLVAQRLGIPCQVEKNLHEHERGTAAYFGTQAEFIEAIKDLLTNPTKLVFGEETGLEARERFVGAVESLMGEYPQENIAIVTHGTVLSLFASKLTGQAAYPFWQALGMPAILDFKYPTMELLAQENKIE